MGVCCEVGFLDDFGSDSGVSGTGKTSVWRWSGCKNQVLTEVYILMIFGHFNYLWELFVGLGNRLTFTI